MVEEITLAIYTLVATGIGIIITLFFNIKALHQNSKSQEYQMTKDFFNQFHELQQIPNTRLGEYVTGINNFTQMALDLHLSGIIKKEMITENLTNIFREAIWIHNNLEGGKTPEMQEFDNWCDEKGITQSPFVASRQEILKKIVRDEGGGLTTYVKNQTD